MKLNKIILCAGVLVLSGNVFAGYEKSVMWGAKWAGLAGSTTAAVEGADAAHFNPAGLTGGPEGELSINLSPTLARFSGVVVPGVNTFLEGEQTLSPIVGFAYKRKINDKWSVGSTLGVVAGTTAEIKSIDFSALGFTGLKPDQTAELQDIEFTLSGAYQVNDKLSLGLAWRASDIQADYKAWFVSGGNLAYLKASGLKDSDYGGYRLGLKYKISDTMGMGFTYRSKVDFKVKGNYTIDLNLASSSTVVPNALSGEATLANALPDQFNLDFFNVINENYTIYYGITQVNYSVNKSILVTGISGADEIGQDWKDQQDFRIATEYKGLKDMTLRGGYTYVTTGTSDEFASATFTPPGPAHIFAFGGGKLFQEKYMLDATLEYTYNAGEGTTEATAEGEFTASAWALHASFKMPL